MTDKEQKQSVEEFEYKSLPKGENELLSSLSSSTLGEEEEDRIEIVEKRIQEEVDSTDMILINSRENTEENYENYVQICLGEISVLRQINFNQLIKLKQQPLKNENKNSKILLLDLDETLIHSDFDKNFEDSNGYDARISFVIDNKETNNLGVFLRPGVKEFLEEVSNHFEIGVFTAGQAEYANEIIKLIDPEGKYIKFRFYQDSCLKATEGLYIKDLSIFNDIDLKNIVLLDNNIYSFANNLSNGVLISSFINDKNDNELENVLQYLIENIEQSEDVREANSSTFHFKEICDCFQ